MYENVSVKDIAALAGVVLGRSTNQPEPQNTQRIHAAVSEALVIFEVAEQLRSARWANVSG